MPHKYANTYRASIAGKATTHNYIVAYFPAERKEEIMESMKKEVEESFNKVESIRMLEHIQDERFLNQIRTLLKLHIEKKGGAA